MENNITIKHILVNDIKKLVDLNGDDINFDIDFRVTSKNGEPFIISVVDQNTLDNQEDLEYKEVEDGIISGNVKNNKNVYQNYFLCLKSITDSDIECNVEIVRKTPPLPNNMSIYEDTEFKSPSSYNNKSYYDCILEWKWYIFIILIVIFAYYIYHNKTKNVLNSDIDNNISVPNNDNMVSEFGSSTSVPESQVNTDIGQQFKFLYSSS